MLIRICMLYYNYKLSAIAIRNILMLGRKISGLVSLFVVFYCLQLACSHKNFKHTCHFSSLYKNKKIMPNPQDKPDELYEDTQNGEVKGRRLQGLVRNPIRITLDTNDFNLIKTTPNGEPQTTATNLAFIKKAMLVVQNFFQARLKVSTISRVFAPLQCVDFNPSSNDINNGISASDLHIYVRYLTDRTIGYGATGKSCKQITTRSLPDLTFQQGRPTVGRIIFNTYNVVDRQTSLTSRLFAEVTTTSLHQTIHILGFDSSLYQDYLDSYTLGNIGNNYSTPIIDQITLNSARTTRTGTDSYILKTPSVTNWAKTFFGCSSLSGMALQNEQSTPGIGSHWQRLAMYDQIMTGTKLGPQKGFSGLTFALLKDMGWYEVDDSFNDTSNYGYHMGCDFYNNACYDTNQTFTDYFCDSTTSSTTAFCSTNYVAKATCTNQSGIMSDGCGLYGGYLNCIDPSQSDDGYKSYTLQKYQTNSFCVYSSFANVGLRPQYKSRCYPFKCFSNYIQFYVDVYTVTCSSSEPNAQKSLPGMGGSLTCPNFVSFCQQSRKICQNWCSQNGYCTRGVCNCLPGFYGVDCSISTCVLNEYYDQTTLRCVTSCPSGTYLNKYSRTCLPCTPPCQQCRDQPTICTGCLSQPNNIQYFWVSNSSCVSKCPPSTYNDGDYCRDCDSTNSSCGTCSYLPTNCTSCVGGKFLQNPFYGTCVNTCSGNYSNYDVVNFKCVTGCIDNLIYYAGGCTACPNPTDGNCNMCANTTYKYIGDQSCHGICPSTYYPNQERRFCQKCHSSCKQCGGPYPQNCTQCQASSNYKYLLLSRMCVAKCPLGFFPNDVSKTCQLCPPDLNCATCTLSLNTTVVCVTCKYNFYLQRNKTCLSSCDNLYFRNTWNNTCDPCHPNCGNCTSYSEGSCTDCQGGRYFLSNITGKFCLSACTTQKYFQSGTNCLDCHASCRTCNGTASNKCKTCPLGLYLSSGMCLQSCPGKKYPNDTTRTCEDCHTDCTFCFGPSVQNCTACTTGKVLNDKTCQNKCPDGLTLNQWSVCSETLLKAIKVIFLGIIMVILKG